jgi:hypothetical protein
MRVARSTPSWISPKAENRNRRVERRDRCAEFGRKRGQRRGYQSPSIRVIAKPQNAKLLPYLLVPACPSVLSVARFPAKKSDENYRGGFTKPRSAA